MNNGRTSLLDRELERLADGELGPAALGALFARLDQTDDGWKRAALALLEAQAFRTACRSAVAPTVAPAIRVAHESPAASRGRRELFAVAVAVLMTCGLGWWAAPTRLDVPASIPTAKSVAETPEETALLEAVQMAFSGADGAWSDPVTAPVIDAADPSAEAWLTMRPTIPNAVREKLAANGQRVREQQTWVPVDLADGRVGVVPVTDLVVAPARPSDYQ